MKNRYMPYGYVVSNGQIQINEIESNVVIKIFEKYIAGLSYSDISSYLTKEKVQYTAEKSIWNKNIIARILKNTKYYGIDNYPQIINEKLFSKLEQSKKPFTKTESDDIKNVKSFLKCQCGEHLKRRSNKNGIERWYCPSNIQHISLSLSDESILNQVQVLQKSLKYAKPNKSKTISMELIKQTNKLELLMSEDNIDQDEIKACLQTIVTEKYNNLNDVNFREIEIIEKLKESDKLDTLSLIEVCESIIICGNKVIKINLKKGLKP